MKTYYTVYQVTNKINGKVYIGTHKTRDLDDEYMGSGVLIGRAIEKYGVGNFFKEILHVYDNPDDMYVREAELVNDEFLSEANTYNVMEGGKGGWDYVNSILTDEQLKSRAKNGRKKTNEVLEAKYGADWQAVVSKMGADALRQCRQENPERFRGRPSANKGVPISKEHREKISRANKGRFVGEKNPNYGKRWIHNVDTLEKDQLLPGQDLPEGWDFGQKPPRQAEKKPRKERPTKYTDEVIQRAIKEAGSDNISEIARALGVARPHSNMKVRSRIKEVLGMR